MFQMQKCFWVFHSAWCSSKYLFYTQIQSLPHLKSSTVYAVYNSTQWWGKMQNYYLRSHKIHSGPSNLAGEVIISCTCYYYTLVLLSVIFGWQNVFSHVVSKLPSYRLVITIASHSWFWFSQNLCILNIERNYLISKWQILLFKNLIWRKFEFKWS